MNVVLRPASLMRKATDWLYRQCGNAPLYPLGALAGLNLFDDLDQAAFGLFGPEIANHFNVSAGLFGLIFVPMIVIGMFLPIVSGYMTDRYDRVKLSVFGGALWFVFAFATGLVTAFWMLALVRVLSAIGRSFTGPTHASLLVDYYDMSGRGMVFSIYQNAQLIGQFLGVVLGGALASVVGWQGVFLLLSLPGLVFLLLVMRLKEPPRGQHERAASASPHEKSPSIAFAMSIRALLRIKSWTRLAWVWLMLGAGLALSSVLPFYFSAVFGVGTFDRGLIVGATTAIQMVTSVVAGIVAQRWMAQGRYERTGQLVIWSSVGSAVAFMGTAVAPTLSWAVFVIIVTTPLRAIAAVPVTLIFAAILPARIRGQGFGAIWVMFALGFWLLPVALALGDATSYRTSMLVAAVPMLFASVLTAMAVRHLATDVAFAKKVDAAGSDPGALEGVRNA